MAFKREALKCPQFFQWGSLSVKRVRIDAAKHAALGPGDQAFKSTVQQGCAQAEKGMQGYVR
jgi:hypothetical protein